MSKRDSSKNEKTTDGTWLDRTEEEVMNLAKDEAAFGAEVLRLGKRHALSRLEIGRLIHVFKAEHGNRYGNALFQRVADMAGMALRSARNCYYLYRLHIEGKDWANLPNLSPSAKYQLARLLDIKQGGKDAILRIAALAMDGKFTVTQVAQLVDEELRTLGGKRRKTPPKEKTPPQEPPDGRPNYGAYEDAISAAKDAFAKYNTADIKTAEIPYSAEHRQNLHLLAVSLLDHVSRIIEENPTDLANYEPTLEVIMDRCQKILATGKNLKEAA